ncbi:hypothetical protein H4Q32_018179 [Labeo rohita]|uniref:DDE Tnp4 domain-containing protein n=1 Tax=Labeo rohita TaxID=84645 RepID=A0ABQ8LBP8_LABRO|nr:hypothetical protein H4Q32_018179 [Labeo rohita]
MTALALLEDIANGRIRRERVFRDQNDFLDHDNDTIQLTSQTLKRNLQRLLVFLIMAGMRLQVGRMRDGWLLGDCSYSLKTWLLTPLTNPQTDRECRYNDAHSRTGSVVERAIGQLKCRWRCLDRTGGMLLYHPNKVCCIVLACGTAYDSVVVASTPDDPNPEPVYVQPNQQAIQACQRVIAAI